MQHQISFADFGPTGKVMADAVSACVHCGFCLPACPTYRLLGQEMDSPRGRIILMKEVLEGNLDLDEALVHVDRCLGCVGCVPACPSGVAYGELVTAFRAHAETQRRRGLGEGATRLVLRETLPYPERFRLAVRAGRIGGGLAGRLGGSFRAMVGFLPEDLVDGAPLPALYPAQGQRRARVALLAGCAQQVLAPQINWATLRVLSRNGVEVVIPVDQGCCGALSMHMGEGIQARELARRNLQAFPSDVDAVITNAAGCGSGMREYPLLFKGHPEEAEAVALAARAVDVAVFLQQLGLREKPPPLLQPMRVAYHDACHLAHAQGVRTEPRQLLGSIGNLTLLEIPEGELCCGSAGTYNVQQPEIAGRLGERKAQNILSTGAEALVTGNVGCLIQIQAHLQRLGRPLPLYHTVELLDAAYEPTNLR